MSDQITDAVEEEVSVDDAFAAAVDELMNEGDSDTDGGDTASEEEPTEGADGTATPADDDTANVDPEPSVADVQLEDGTAAVDTSVPAPDYKALYDQAMAANAAAASQVDQLVDQKFNSWRGRVEEEERQKAAQAAAATASAEPRQMKPMEISDEMQEVFELYPDLLPQIQTLVDGRVSNEVSEVENRVKELIDTQVKPIQTHVQQSELNAHERAITTAHPDIRQRIASGEFRQWVDALPSYQKAGAELIVNQGTADEVIGLFDSFKADADGTQAAATKSPKQKAVQAPAAPAAQTASTVSRVKDALAVPAAPGEPAQAREEEPEDPEALFLKVSKELMQEEALGY